jgi:hypothetical protein
MLLNVVLEPNIIFLETLDFSAPFGSFPAPNPEARYNTISPLQFRLSPPLKPSALHCLVKRGGTS